MAGIAGLLTRHTPVLGMRCRNERRIIHVQALAVLAHDMAAQAERRLLCPFHVVLKSQHSGKHRENEECQKCQYLSPARKGQVRAKGNQSGQEDRYNDNSEYQGRGHDASRLWSPTSGCEYI